MTQGKPTGRTPSTAQQIEALREQMYAIDRKVDALSDRLQHAIAGLEMRAIRAERAENGVADAGTSPTANSSTREAASEPRAEPEHSAFDYFMFEQRFRGTMTDIKQRQSLYLDLFEGCAPVLDVGCGRGEFLDLLTERDIPATGLDSNPDMVAFSRERGHTVELADAFDYLCAIQDGALGGIFAAQVVEHVPPERIFDLSLLWRRAMRTGGVAVAETINTRCPDAMTWFYLDPTHIRPVPPELLSFAFEQAGFAVESIRFSSPVPDSGLEPVLTVTAEWPAEIARYQDYAVVGRA